MNGGLFEPIGGYDWQTTNVLIANDTIQRILDTFDLYNFTVREDEPLDKEVAVDPEMLGKVFENLLEVNDRKSKGAFYTPREIVHYMCQESLINYLDTTINRQSVEIVPPQAQQTSLFATQPSGQLPLTQEEYCERVPRGDLERLIRQGERAIENDAVVVQKGSETPTYQFQVPESVRTYAAEIDRALADIKICDPAIGSGAFPVGMMQEIVKVRGVLTTYLPDEGRTAYAFKRHAIQSSIYGVDIDPGAVDIAKLRLWLSLVVDEDDYTRINPLPNLDYKIVCGNSLLSVEKNLFNHQVFDELEQWKQEYFEATNAERKAALRATIQGLIQTITNQAETFDFDVYFSEVFQQQGGFDVVIGNPPYLNFKSYSSVDREKYKVLYREVFDGKADLLYYFLFKGMALLNTSGHLSFITSRYWLEAEFAAKLRKHLSNCYRICEILDFSNAVIFDQGTKVAISTLAKTKSTKDEFRVLSYIGKKFEGLDAHNLKVSFIKQSKLLSSDNRWIFVETDGSEILAKIVEQSVSLGEIAFCKQGIVTGRDKAFVFESTSVISELPNSVVKPWVKVGDIHRYVIQPVKKRFLVYSNDLEKISEYPKFHDWLKQNSEKLKNRREVKSGRIRWFDLQWPREKRFFENDKFICRFKAERNTFAWDTEGLYCSADITLVILKDEFRNLFDPKYILALLNSRLLDYYFKSYAKLMDYRYEYYPKPVSLLRIRQASVAEQKLFIPLVDRILAAKAEDAAADVSTWEREIDQLVYSFCGLTEEEIKIVEGKSEP